MELSLLLISTLSRLIAFGQWQPGFFRSSSLIWHSQSHDEIINGKHPLFLAPVDEQITAS